ncbi:MAG: hypothetical protein RBR78_01360 [Flavobacteriaceae bacterium]|jgi:hypothetical protein|nr:hypothetical protein [Flavobacteriaceae bacterium]
MSTAKLLNQLVQKLGESSDLSVGKIYNQTWMLKCVMEQIAKRNLKHDDLTFPEDSKWCSDALVSTFNKTNCSRLINITVGHIQIKKKKPNFPRYSSVEIKQDCSCLYSISLYSDFADDVLSLMKLVYDGLKEGKIISFPDKIACYKLSSDDFELTDFNEVKIKNEIKKDIINPTKYHLYTKIIEKEDEINWLINNLDDFIEKLEVKIILWKDLIESIESPETRTEITAFYNKWNEK